MSDFDLDDLNAIAERDSQDVLTAIERFADQCREGWEIGRATTGLPDSDGVDAIVVLGVGGSGVSGDVVQAVVEPRLPLPFRTVKSYGPLPEWVGRNTLVFAVSYSGDTEETLAAVDDALQRGARIVAITSGGALQEAAARSGLALVKIPPGFQPRAGLGYLAMPLLAVLVEMGLLPDMQDDIDDAIETLGDIAERCHRKHPTTDNPAKDLAKRLEGRIAIVYGGSPIGAVAAYRFKCDLNEYAETVAFWNEIPELDHNEIVGWSRLSDDLAQRFCLVLLRDPQEHDRIALRFDVTKRLVQERFSEVIELTAEGTSAIARILSLVLLTQLAAIYRAFLHGVDPAPVGVLDEVKAELAAE